MRVALASAASGPHFSIATLALPSVCAMQTSLVLPASAWQVACSVVKRTEMFSLEALYCASGMEPPRALALMDRQIAAGRAVKLSLFKGIPRCVVFDS